MGEDPRQLLRTVSGLEDSLLVGQSFREPDAILPQLHSPAGAGAKAMSGSGSWNTVTVHSPQRGEDRR